MIHSARLSEIAARKARLVGECARQRDELAAALDAWRGPLGVVDRSLRAARVMSAHPVLMVAAVIAVVVLGRRHLVRWAGRGIVLWKTWNTVRGLLGSFVTRGRAV